MKEVCLCITKETGDVHSVAFWDEEKEAYYSSEGGGWFDLERNKQWFDYVELTFAEFRSKISEIKW